MDNQYKRYLQAIMGPGAIILSPKYLELKERAEDHFEDCTQCTQGDDGKICPVGETLIKDVHAAMDACVKNARQ